MHFVWNFLKTEFFPENLALMHEASTTCGEDDGISFRPNGSHSGERNVIKLGTELSCIPLSKLTPKEVLTAHISICAFPHRAS